MTTNAVKTEYTYKRHEPEKTVLYKAMADNLETWISQREAEGKNPLPTFVENELRAFLDCGILESGFSLVSCDSCSHVLPVAHSCKKRGFCPSCGAKRMSETTQHLTENVLPHVPYRQWVVTFPYALRFWMATSRELTCAVHKILSSTIMSYYTTIAEERRIIDPHSGGATFFQRFGSALNLNFHSHIIMIDGVYSEVEGSPKFFTLPGPDNDYVSQIVEAIADSVISLLRKKGYICDEGEWVDRPDSIDPLFSECQQLTESMVASVNMMIAFGENAGKRVRRIGRSFGYEEETPLIKGPRCASTNGFTVHANRFIGAQERKKLKDLISYAARPAFSHERLSLKDPHNPEGDVVYRLKTRWHDGTEAIVLTQTELIEKLVALIPQPRTHMTRYVGVLSSHSALRDKIILKPHIKKGFVGLEDGSVARVGWALLLKYAFAIDILRCQSCGAKIRPESCIPFKDPIAIKKALLAMGIDYHPPPIKPARIRTLQFDFDDCNDSDYEQ